MNLHWNPTNENETIELYSFHFPLGNGLNSKINGEITIAYQIDVCVCADVQMCWHVLFFQREGKLHNKVKVYSLYDTRKKKFDRDDGDEDKINV